jgi:predicted secreted Zn-dependent protease
MAIFYPMVKIAFLLIFFALPALPTHSQNDADTSLDELTWNEFYKIQWVDFQGQPEKNSVGDAGTAVQIRAKPFLVDKEIHYDVVAIFSRKKSWSRDQAASLLAHERLHFDIAEVYARKIRKKIKELKGSRVNNIKTYNSAIHELLLESNQADQQYDLETLHGALSKKQRVWAERIKEELADLSAYKKSRRVIGR